MTRCSVSIDAGCAGKFSPGEWTLAELKAIIAKWQTCMIANDGWKALYLENHDQSRSVSRFTPHHSENRAAAAKMLATFIGLQAGTLFVYQGQELGMINLPRHWGIEEYKDIETHNLYQLYVASWMALTLSSLISTDLTTTVPWNSAVGTRTAPRKSWNKYDSRPATMLDRPCR